MKTLLIVLFTCTALVGQTRDKLKRKYGEPVSETFKVRPGIVVTVTYGTAGHITELLITPQTTDLIKSRNALLNKADVKAIIDQLVPSSRRCKFVIGEFVNLNCLPENDCVGVDEDYERLTIYYNSTAEEGKVHYAVVQWKQ
jgi:hypothetical protein